MVGDLKGSCSREMNKRSRRKALEWQRGFGVVSFGRKQLPWVRAYVRNQKEHHSAGTDMEKLERYHTWDEGEEAN